MLARLNIPPPPSFLADLFPWRKLRAGTTSKPAVISFLAIATIPALARLLIEWHDLMERLHRTSNLRIPVNLELLTLAGVFFAVGAAIITLRAPNLIKRFPNFRALQNGDHSEADFLKDFHAAACIVSGKPEPRLIQQYIENATGRANVSSAQAAEMLSGEAGPALMPLYWQIRARDRLDRAYDFASGYADRIRPWSRLLCGLFVGLGWISMLSIEGYNIWSLIHYVRIVGV